MWDLYKTQLPLLTALAPHRAVELVAALLSIKEEEGNFPIGYRMARGTDRFFRQGSALAHTLLRRRLRARTAWHRLGLRRSSTSSTTCAGTTARSILEKGVAHPITHTLDLAHGYHCTAVIARHVGDHVLADHLDGLAERWINAFDPATGLLVDSTFYEGGPWNYSFRLLHDMAARDRPRRG